MKRCNIIKSLKTLVPGATSQSPTKELNLVEVDGNQYYHLGIWSADHSLPLSGILLTETEMQSVIQTIKAEKTNTSDLELERFQKDYIQQSHNGNVLEKERTLER